MMESGLPAYDSIFEEISQFGNWNGSEVEKNFTTWCTNISSNSNITEVKSCKICKMDLMSVKHCEISNDWISRFSKRKMEKLLESAVDVVEKVPSNFMCEKCYYSLVEWDYHVTKAHLLQKFLKMQWNSLVQEMCETNKESIELKKASFSEKVETKTIEINEKDIAITGSNNAPKTHEDPEAKFKVIKKSDKSKRKKIPMEELNASEVQDKIWNEKGCNFCDFSPTSSSSQLSHERSHYCEHCNIFLERPSMMRNHLKKVHNINSPMPRPKPFKCSHCCKKYASAGSLHNHVSTVHSTRQYRCDICKQLFQHPRLLQTHLVRHEEKGFLCAKCPAKFHLQVELNKHDNQVHSKVRPYKCDICLKKFCQRSVLKHHLSQHADHEARPALEPSIRVVSDSNEGLSEIEATISDTCVSEIPHKKCDYAYSDTPNDGICSEDVLNVQSFGDIDSLLVQTFF